MFLFVQGRKIKAVILLFCYSGMVSLQGMNIMMGNPVLTYEYIRDLSYTSMLASREIPSMTRGLDFITLCGLAHTAHDCPYKSCMMPTKDFHGQDGHIVPLVPRGHSQPKLESYRQLWVL